MHELDPSDRDRLIKIKLLEEDEKKIRHEIIEERRRSETGPGDSSRLERTRNMEQ
jgi:hypothetical protein